MYMYSTQWADFFSSEKREHFSSLNEWTTSEDMIEDQKKPLSTTQKEEVTNMIKQISSDQLKDLVAAQSPLLTGPIGPMGPSGPSGSPYIASGRIVNKQGSFHKDAPNKMIPQMVMSRSEGTNPQSSLSFMDTVSPFVSYQNWMLKDDHSIQNRYDQTCLTMNPTQEKVYMDKCTDGNPNQKWDWDNSNRIVSTSASTPQNLKCLALSSPQENTFTTSLPNCVGEDCLNHSAKQYVIVKDCNVNQITDDEIWSFI
jgi:hypothetical protein